MTPPRILLLEDSPLDAELALSTLKEGGVTFEYTHVTDRESFLLALHQAEYDLILADYALHNFDGFEALEIVKVTTPETPFIFVSGTLGEDLAIESLHNGATDYVLKQNLRRLVPAVERALKTKEDKDTYLTTANALRESEIRYRQVIESINEYAIISLDVNGYIRSWNNGAERIFGFLAHEVIGHHFRLFFTEDDQKNCVPEQELVRAREDGRANDERWQIRRVPSAGGYRTEEFWASGVLSPIMQDGRISGFTKILRDHTKEKLAYEENLKLAEQINTERERLANIITNIQGVVWETEGGVENPRCVYASQYAETLTGYTASEWMSNASIAPPLGMQIIHKDDLLRVQEQLERLLRTGVPEVFQLRWIKRNGESIWVESYVSLVRSGDRVKGFRGVTLDITERKAAQDERESLLKSIEHSRDRVASLLHSVEERELRYRMIADAMPVIVWSSNAEGKTIYLNQQWEKHTGVSQEQSMEDGFDSFIHPDDLILIRERWQAAATRKDNFEAEIRIRDASGAFPWFLVRAVPILSPEGEIMQWIGTSTPVDEQKRTRENFRFVAEASAILGSSLDYETTLRSVAQLAVPQIADWCSVDMVNAEGKVERLAVTHVDPAKVAWSYELQDKYPPDWDAPTGVPNVIRTGQSEFYPFIPQEMLEAVAIDEEHLRIINEIGFTSAIIVPLIAREFVLGAITFVTAESGRRYTEDDLALAEDLGRRAGTAIDNAWLYRKAQEEISERRRVEDEVRLSETRFRTLVEQSPLGIQIYSNDGYCLQVNAAWSELFTIESTKIIGHNVFHNPQLVEEELLPYLKRAFKGETVSVPAIHYTHESIVNRSRWVRAFSYPVKEASGELREVALIVEDITDRFEAEETLRKAKDAAEAANQAKDKFLAILSHELRTPLTPVLTSVQILEGDKDFPPEYREWLDIIHRNVELEARLIDDLLDLTRISKGKLKLNNERVDMHRIIKHVADIYRSEIESRELKLILELQAAHHEVIGDPARLQQVLWNLLKNAVKFTPSNGKIVISTVDKDGEIEVTVKDSGIGIDPEVISRIFDAFEQGEQTVTRHFGGLGLGLAISKNLVEIHKGRIAAHSEGRDRGALFTINLPIASEKATSGSENVSVPSSSSHTTNHKHSVLLVDDHADTSHALKLLLERRGFTVTTAANVEDALHAVEDQGMTGKPFDLIISDIGLPDASGLELMKEVRTRLPQMKAIALSGFGTDEDIKRSREAGFAEHLTKPFNFQKLEEVVRHLLS